MSFCYVNVMILCFFIKVKKNFSTKNVKTLFIAMFRHFSTLIFLPLFYPNKLQNTIENSIPITSAINAAVNTNLIFFTPTQLVYTAIVYNVVSVEPIIVDAINPIFESTPKLVIISVATAVDALPEIGLIKAKGIISLGIPKKFVTGDIKLIIKSKTPELLNAPIATNNPINVGKILKTICIPSFAPSKKVSNTLFFSNNPYISIRSITIGIALEDKYLIKSIVKVPSFYYLFSLEHFINIFVTITPTTTAVIVAPHTAKII